MRFSLLSVVGAWIPQDCAPSSPPAVESSPDEPALSVELPESDPVWRFQVDELPNGPSTGAFAVRGEWQGGLVWTEAGLVCRAAPDDEEADCFAPELPPTRWGDVSAVEPLSEVAYTTEGGQVVLVNWREATARTVAASTGGARAQSLALAPDGSLALGNSSGIERLERRQRSGKESWREGPAWWAYGYDWGVDIHGIALSPDGRTVAAGSSWRDGWCGASSLVVLDGGQPFSFSLSTIGLFGGATAPVWLDARYVAIGSFDFSGSLGIADRKPGAWTVPTEILHLENAQVEPVHLLSDGRLLIRVRAWQSEGAWMASVFSTEAEPAFDRLYRVDLRTGELEPFALPVSRSVTPLRSLEAP